MFGRKSFVLVGIGLFAGVCGVSPSGAQPASRRLVSQGNKRSVAPLGTPTNGQVALPAPALATYQPNELGRIPILEYHAIGGPPEFPNGPLYDSQGLNIAPDTFRRQLKLMYAAGWFPINMRDALSAHIDVPKGKIPVVLTFDDARPSQFRYRPDGSLDPNCAIGILEAFHAAHPDWPRRATFYVLPESAWNGVPFDQDGLETKKLRQLARWGYEIGNHSTSHRNMRNMDARTLRWEMAACVRYINARVPHVTIDTMALPYGVAPSNPALWDCLLHGTQGGTTYRNRCILLAVGEPSYPPLHKQFDPKQVMRVLAAPDNIETWIQWLKPGQPLEPFISDGNPNTVTIPQSSVNDLDRGRLDGARLVILPD